MFSEKGQFFSEMSWKAARRWSISVLGRFDEPWEDDRAGEGDQGE